MNTEHFSDLPKEEQTILLDYIAESFVPIQSINQKYSAYGLKQHFTSTHILSLHTTTRCFMEAMVAAGFSVKPVPDVTEPNWYFNIGKPLYL